MLAVELNGGLGNQLFQLAAADTIARETGRIVCTVNAVSPQTAHTTTNYMSSVLSAWATRPPLPTPYTIVDEPSFAKHDWKTMIPSGPVCLRGYFQNWRYIHPEVRNKIRLPQCAPLEGAFLHIRGGDYVGHWLHDVGLSRRYYQRAVQQFPAGTHFYVFTNDIAYASQCPVLKTISYTIVQSDDVTSLSQMAACTRGGICANSSFSWWGAYLNPKRTIVMPDMWFNGRGFHTDGYYFPGVITCPV